MRGTSLAVQRLRLCTPSAGGMDSIPGRGTSHMPQGAAKKRKKTKKKKNKKERMGHGRSEHFSLVHQYAKLRRIIHSLTLSPPLKGRGLKEKKKTPGDLETVSDLSCK